jgi:hypothetical protein
MSELRTNRIRTLNDTFRQTGRGGRIMVTSGVREHGGDAVIHILKLVAEYRQFTEDNDPYGEHDFGAFDYRGQKYFWKIDYYDANCRYGSEQPDDPTKTTRVLTIMLASEY